VFQRRKPVLFHWHADECGEAGLIAAYVIAQSSMTMVATPGTNHLYADTRWKMPAGTLPGMSASHHAP
jgi:hypothetical protein